MFDRHKNNKLLYYIRNGATLAVPKSWYRVMLQGKLAAAKRYDDAYIRFRVNYYNKLMPGTPTGDKAQPLHELKLGKGDSTYFFDSHAYARYFNEQLKARFLFGDITYVPDEPSIVKSRPIGDNNANGVLLNLNKFRHFVFAKDTQAFRSKKDMLVWRGNVYQEHRIRFMQMYFGHPLCNIGQVNTDCNPEWVVERMTIGEQLDYKFILCLEGNDVASNLKWVMSSHSVAVMPKPRFETWFMEGTLQPGVHYICIKDDYSDVEERLQYYIQHPEQAEQIVAAANAYVQQFRNQPREDVIALLVLQKYFYATGQLPPTNTSMFTQV